MICQQCKANNPDGSRFCLSCGASLSGNLQMTPAPTTGGAAVNHAPNPNAPASPKKNYGKLGLIVSLASIAAAFLIVAVVALVTCDGRSGVVNLDELVKEDGDTVAEQLQDYEIAQAHGNLYYTQSDMKDLIESASVAFESYSQNSIDKIAEDIEDQKPWAVAIFEQNDELHFEDLKTSEIKGTDGPTEALYRTYRVLDDPSAEDIYNIARKVVEIDSLDLGFDPTEEGKDYYLPTTYCFGYGEGPDTIVSIWVGKLGDVYEISVSVYNTNKVEGSVVDDYVSNFRNNFNTYFNTAESFSKK